MFVNSGGLRLWCLMFKKTWSKKTLIVTTGLNDEKKQTINLTNLQNFLKSRLKPIHVDLIIIRWMFRTTDY